jgi:O-6-methylguanine DNA methyltransferase
MHLHDPQHRHRLHRAVISTPLGDMLALASEKGLCALEFDAPSRHQRLDARLQRWFPPHEIVDGETDTLRRTREWLAAYFDGASAEAAVVPLDMRGAAFELRVWATLRRIPPGETSTYGAIAKDLEAPGASRAVGAANGANPVGIIVPCHRVIGSTGKLTGYGGGLHRKQWLLDHEARWRRQSSLF